MAAACFTWDPGMVKVMIERGGELVDHTGIDLAEVSARVTHPPRARDTWGTWMWVGLCACLRL